MATRIELVDLICTYRRERDWPYEKAREAAIAEFIKRGWELPKWAKPAEGTR